MALFLGTAPHEHPSNAQPGHPLAPSAPGRSLRRAVVGMLHSGHTWHCVVAKVWMNHLATELAISTSGFPEHALPSMCLDCSRKAWRPPSRPDLLSHQIVICKHSSVQPGSTIRAQRSLHSQERSLHAQETACGFIVLSETAYKAAGNGITGTLFSTISQGCAVTGN